MPAKVRNVNVVFEADLDDRLTLLEVVLITVYCDRRHSPRGIDSHRPMSGVGSPLNEFKNLLGDSKINRGKATTK